MLEFLIWVYVLSLVIVGLAISYDLYERWERGADIYFSDFFGGFTATICPFWNTFLVLYLISAKTRDIVLFRGKKM
jgi:hypothetical protein